MMTSSDFNSVALITPKTEIEIKLNVPTQENLHDLLEAFLSNHDVSQDFWHYNAQPYFKKFPDEVGILKTRPISWYLDTEQWDLFKNKASLRCRLTPYLRDYVQVGVKGKLAVQSEKEHTDVIRHEDEVKNENGQIEISSTIFTDENTRNLIKPATGQEVFYNFATDVRRQMVGIPFQNKKEPRLFFEVCFDPIIYIRPVNSAQNKDCNPLDFETVEFHRLNQMEIEFVNPATLDPDFRDILELSTNPRPEQVQHALKKLNQMFKDLASTYNIPIGKAKGSKAKTGFKALGEIKSNKRYPVLAAEMF